MIPVYKPFITARSLAPAHNALDGGEIAQGAYKAPAAELLAAYLGVKHAVLVSNGTVATHLVFKALKYRHPEIERVVFPNNSYVAVWNAALFDGAPEWAMYTLDADLLTWNAEYGQAHNTVPMDKHTAVMVVHNLGNPVNVPALKRKYPQCVFIEDNCEGLFAEHEGSMTGTQSLCSSLSFYGNKTLTTGEGGAFITNDTELFNWITRVYSQGQTETKFVHDVLAYNYRMSNLQAALLWGQLGESAEIRRRKEMIFNLYRIFLGGSGVRTQFVEAGCKHSTWMFGVRIEEKSYAEAAPWFAAHGIETRPMFYPISVHKHLKDSFVIANKQPNAAKLAKECVVLPSFPDLQSSEIEYICDRVREFAK